MRIEKQTLNQQVNRLDKLGAPPLLTKDMQIEIAMSKEETIAHKVWETVFSRDGVENGTRTRQSLTTYEWDGQIIQDISIDDRKELIRQTVAAIQHTTIGKETEEAFLHLDLMGAVLPDLVSALASHAEHVNGAYKPDLLSLATIAIDWFEHPEAIAQTHIRVGMGGEESVNARIPAYIVPTLETQRQIKIAFGRYSVWAVQRELFDRAVAGLSDENKEQKEQKEKLENSINTYLAAQTALQAGPDSDGNKPTNMLSIPYQQGLAIIEEAWKKFLPDVSYEETLPVLAQKYHFTTDVPTLVVFNAANTAVQINDMNPELVLSSQKETQALLSDFAHRFYGDVAEAMVFQDDLPWEKHTYVTEMLLQYARHIVLQSDGKREHAQDVLGGFGKHHSKTEGKLIYGIPSSDIYGYMHPFMFGDYEMQTHGVAKLPNAGVMQELPPARNVIFHQAPPERTFGIIRKLVAENATVEGFVEWLTRRERLSELQAADRITALFQNAVAENLPPKALLGRLFKGVSDMKAGEPELAVILSGLLTSERVKSAGEHILSTLQEVIQELRDETPSTEEMPQIMGLKKQISALPAQVSNIRSVINLVLERNKREDREEWEMLRRDQRVIRMNYPMRRLELQLSVGEGSPVYYPVKGVDTMLYPSYESSTTTNRLVGLPAYDNNLQVVSAQRSRLDKTTKYVVKQVGVKGGEVPTGDVPQIAIETMQQLFQAIDQLEQSGGEVTPEWVNGLIGQAKSYLHNNLQNIDEGISLDQLVRAATVKAREKTMKDALGNEAKATAARNDYLVLLRSIDRDDLVHADTVYQEFLEELYRE